MPLTTRLTFERRLRRVPAACALGTFGIAVGALFVRAVFPEVAAAAAVTRASTSVGLLLAAVALWLARRAGANQSLRAVRTLAVLVVALGAGALFGYGCIEHFPSRLAFVPPTPLASGYFVLLGLALLSLDLAANWRRHPGSFFILPLLLASQLNLIGYLYGESWLYRFGPHEHLSWFTPAGFFLMAVGVAYARPANGPLSVLASRTVGGLTARRLLPIVCLVPLALGWAWLKTARDGLISWELGISLFVALVTNIFAGVTAFVAHRLNVIERREREVLAREHRGNQRLIETLNNAPIIIWTLDLSGVFTFCEGRALKGLGFRADDVVGRHYEDVFKTYPVAAQWVRDALAGGTFAADIDLRGRHLSSSYAPIRDDDGVINGASVVSTDITERRSSEQDFETLVNNIAQLAWMTDASGSIYWFNQRWYDYTGRTPETALGWRWTETFEPDNLKKTSAVWERASVTGQVFEEVNLIRGKDGAYRHFLTRAVPIRDSAGRVIRWFGTNTDIEDARRSEQKIANVLDAMGDAFFVVDRNFEIIELNANHERLSRVPRDSQIGRNLFNLYPGAADPTSKYFINYSRAMKQRIGVEFEDYYAPLGIWTAVYAYPTADGGLAVFFRDITEKRLSQRRIEAERLKFERIFDDSPVLMALLRGPDLVFERVNPNYQLATGYRELVGKPIAEALPELTSQSFINLMKGVFKTGQSYTARESVANLIRTPGGEPEPSYFNFTYSRVDDADGAAYGIFIHADDVSDRVRARKQLEKLTQDLTESVRARDEFLSIASHELKTPLTSLKLQSQIFQRMVTKGDPRVYLPERVDKLVDQTEKQTSRLTRLVDDMLDVARIRSGKLTLEPETFDLSDLVTETIDRLRGHFGTSGKAVPELRDADRTPGRWDKLRIEQVVTNLFTNAIRYGAGKPVHVRVHNLPDDFVRISVEDHGVGIAESARTKIFDRFERAIHANEVSGLGLGLFISKQIVDAHGGRIWVESELGVGSTFFVDLPRETSIPGGPSA